MKKLLSILAVLAMILSCAIIGIGTVASAAEESSEEDFIVFDGVLEEYVGEGGDVVIPASLGIKEIAEAACQNNSDITSLVIPEGVETIGGKAFNHCENLAEIILPYSLTELSQHEFSGAAITSLTIPGNCEIVSYGCFSSCTYLTELTLSYGVKEIMPLAFQGTSIEKVIFPETVEIICGGSAFGHNKNELKGTIEYYICNPDCEIGSAVVGAVKAHRHEWTDVETPWSHNKAAAQYRIYVIEGSEVDKFLTEQGETLLHAVDSGRDDNIKLYRKDAQFFKDMPENKEGYGTPKPGTNNNNTQQGSNQPSTPNNNVENSNSNNNNNNNDSQNTTGGDVQYVTEGSDNSTIIIVVCVIGGIMLLAIIAVVILAATGVLFGKKKSASSGDDDIEALKAKLEVAELKAKLAALEGDADAEETAEDNSDND